MIEIELAAVANQSFSARLDGSQYDLTIKESSGAMCATVSRGGVTLVSGLPIVAGTPILPYRYQESGNFVLTTENDALPYWTEFGVTQSLVFVTDQELADARA